MQQEALVIMVLLGAQSRAGAVGNALVPKVHRIQAAPRSILAVPKYVGGIGLSLGKPFFASELMSSINSLTSRIDTRDPSSADLLRAEILGSGPGSKSPAQMVATLGLEPLPAGQAAALLVTNAMAEPDGFPQVLGRLDQMKPGLGKRVSESLKTLGVNAIPTPLSTPYLRGGELDPIFRGAAVAEDNPLRP